MPARPRPSQSTAYTTTLHTTWDQWDTTAHNYNWEDLPSDAYEWRKLEHTVTHDMSKLGIVVLLMEDIYRKMKKLSKQ